MGILKGGFKNGAKVTRCSSDGYKPESFSAFSPKLFAGITEIDDVLLSRCIKINMKQIKVSSEIEEFVLTPKLKKENLKLKNDLHIFGLKYADEISKLYQDKNLLVFPDNYTPREKDLWKPLFTIAKIVDEENKTKTTNSILEYAKILREELEKERYKEIEPRLIKHLEILVNEQDTVEFKNYRNWYMLSEIFACLKDTGEFPDVKSPESLGKYLKKFEFQKSRLTYGIIGHKERKTAYYITKEDIQNLKKKYGLDTM